MLAVTKGGVGIAAHLSCDVFIQASSAVQSGLKFGVVQLQGGNFFCKLGRAPAITAKSRLQSPPAPGGPSKASMRCTVGLCCVLIASGTLSGVWNTCTAKAAIRVYFPDSPLLVLGHHRLLFGDSTAIKAFI